MKIILLAVAMTVSQFAFAFAKGDLVASTAKGNITGPYTLQGCYVQANAQTCVLAETGEFVQAQFLRAYVSHDKSCAFKRFDKVVNTNPTVSGPYTVNGLFVNDDGQCTYQLYENDEFVNETFLRLFQ